MDRVGVRNFGSGDDRGDIEVGIARRRRPDAHRMVGQPHVHRIGVGGGMHRDRLDAHFMRGAVDAQRDLAAIGDQQAGNGHACQPIMTSGWSYSTGCELSISTAVTVPANGAVIGFMTFIASMISSVSPALTVWPMVTKGGVSGSDAR